MRTRLISSLRTFPGSLLNPGSILLYAPVAFAGAIPIFVLRKQTISSKLIPCLSRSQQLTLSAPSQPDCHQLRPGSPNSHSSAKPARPPHSSPTSLA